MISYQTTNSSGRQIDEKTILSGLELAESKLPPIAKSLITIEFVSPEESQTLNLTWRKINEPTDVISLAVNEANRGQQIVTESDDGKIILQTSNIDQKPIELFGQLVICPQVVANQADRAGQEFERELEWVVAHGILHVAGFHHDD